MVYTEIKIRNNRKYYYRTLSIRKGTHVAKQRIYLGVNLSKQILKKKEKKADIKLIRDIELNKLVPKILKVLNKHNIKKAGIFGSYARGEQKKSSDIDILVEPPQGMGFEFFGISDELEEKLGKKVDLVSYNGLNHLIKNDILKDEVKIL